ncbi:ATP-binding protein [Pseudoflavonifractor sp. An85]|uniref:ATP-binding protein n=1 Tax=Pseudoflavonifractor sp. An85 TaxID=1965661 RepID=UPI000B3892FA|nr:ATP-binding protein [Pseudoflavonifractor sp. An85]OUN22426.1 hypothetical protein B5G37_09980 [Pseudoflavonifractor sp. An85]
MNIISMTATFGKLEGATLTLSPGLNILTAPNECGKSTWVAFLTAMLYGIDTRERDKVGHLAQKTKYQPWSGAAMAGEIRLEWQGQYITLRRFANRSGPFGGFEAVYTATGDPVPFLTTANVGETLTGVSREVFVRCALVGQGDTAVTAAPDLERRIAALATTGEEEVSYSETQRTLKDWRNRRQANRSTGLIPQLEGELAQVRRTLEDTAQARQIQAQARQELARLQGYKGQLERQLAQHQAYRQQALNQRYAQALQQQAQALAQLDALPAPDPRFAGLTAAQAMEQAGNLNQQGQEHSRQRQQAQARRQALSGAMKLWVPLLGVGGLLLIILGFFLTIYPLSFVGFGCMALAVILAMVLVAKMGKYDKILYAPTPSQGESTQDALQRYLDWLTQHQALEAQAGHARERVADLEAQGAQPTTAAVTPPAGVPQVITAQLRQVEGQMAQWQTRLDQATGALGRDTLETESRRGELAGQIAQRQEEYQALTLALEGLEEANAALRQRFSPALNEKAGQLLSRLTGGQHCGLTLARDLTAQVEQEGVQLPHSQLFLSSGAQEQLYLALRLALAQLTAPQAPLVLDDTLAYFDDQRAQAALELLANLAQERQVLLFSCHSREAAWGKNYGANVAKLS